MLRTSVTGALLAAACLPVAAQAADRVKGAALFQHCAICHSVEPGKKSSVGPNLAAIVGRKAGTAAFTYSAAMKNSNILWTTFELDAFLAQPGVKVKGTRMAFSGLRNAQDRADLIAFLASGK